MAATFFAFAGCFDTETTQLTDSAGGGPRAFTVSWQWNDLRGRDLLDYTLGRDDRLHISSDSGEFMAWLRDVIAWGERVERVPVVAAYNLAFDLQSLMGELAASYRLTSQAQSGRTYYTVDLWTGDRQALRFWDAWHLNKSGLAVMGLLAGVPKLTGSWDYELPRLPETPLTVEEQAYALRDVQVIPAYLRYVLEANPWIGQDEFGHTVQTQTSLVRRYGREKIGCLYATEKVTLWEAYVMRCTQEAPKTWASYAARRACFRGGLAFTGAKLASVPVENVASLDVTSMHHTFMARFIPVSFRPVEPRRLMMAARRVLDTPREKVLGRYYKPFTDAFHACFRFTHLRIKPGTAFEEYGIGTLARSRFAPVVARYDEQLGADLAEEAAADSVMRDGFRDTCVRGRFCLSKLMEADACELWLNEVELWILSRVYAWDSMEAVSGEATSCWRKAPDYIGLMSRTLYAQKAQTKELIRAYVEGEPFTGVIGDHVPENIAVAARAGTLTGGNAADNTGTLDSFYLYLKQMFNAIYGTLAQDEMKPAFRVRNGSVEVDPDTVPSGETFERLKHPRSKVLYTQGMRIVAGSRLHLVLGIELLYEALGSRCDVLGGDTDSLKCRLDEDVTDEELMTALEPLHRAADWCLERGYYRARRNYPGAYVQMTGVGHFDIEDCGTDKAGNPVHRYAWHVELWNKCRVSIDAGGRAHVTCAGLSRPRGAYTIENWIEDAARHRGAEWVLSHGLGYNCLVRNDLCHMLGRTHPSPDEVFDEDVTDYTGRRGHVTEPMAVCLYKIDKMIGDPAAGQNIETLNWLYMVYGREPDTSFRILERGGTWRVIRPGEES